MHQLLGQGIDDDWMALPSMPQAKPAQHTPPMSAVEAILEDEEYLDQEFTKLTPVAQTVVN